VPAAKREEESIAIRMMVVMMVANFFICSLLFGVVTLEEYVRCEKMSNRK
jgi:hypothetical protein